MKRHGEVHHVEPLTEREQDVLHLLAQGRSNRELAAELVLSLNTVKWYARQIYAKLGVANREEAVARARALGLLAEEAEARPLHNLPLQLSSFVGREKELAQVGDLLSTSRLLTLTGPGGCGKTRLALQAASGVLTAFPGGVWLVELAPLSDPRLVPQAVAETLGLREAEGRSWPALLQSFIRDRKLLLVLDNCEHLVDATAHLAESLISRCPELKVLTTSREPLNISGETVWPVPPLSLPDEVEPASLTVLTPSDAVRLFVERATAALPGFLLSRENAAAVVQVCRQLDGLPLAIELAAAQVRLLRVEQLASRLDERFHTLAGGSRTAMPRHQALNALIDWSYDLLTASEQRLLRHLSVFAGGFSLEAAEAVCSEDDGAVVLELLAKLVNKSLVVTTRERGKEARYHLLETIRRYALEKLKKDADMDVTFRRHLAYFCTLAETAEPFLQSAEQLVWLDRLETDYANFRAAMAWSLESSDDRLEWGLRLATSLVPYWIFRAHHREGRHWLDAAMTSREGVDTNIQAQLLLHVTWLWLEQSEDDPTALLHESLSLFRDHDDMDGVTRCLGALGWCAWARTDLEGAATYWNESLQLADKVADTSLVPGLYYGLAWIAMSYGDFDQAVELGTLGLARARETGDRRMQARHLLTLARGARVQLHYNLAETLLRDALSLAREYGDRSSEAQMLAVLGGTARAQRDYDAAAAYYHDSLALYQDAGYVNGVARLLLSLGLVAVSQGDHLEAKHHFNESIRLSNGPGRLENNTWSLWGLAQVAMSEGRFRRAARLLAVVKQVMELQSIDPADRHDYEHHKAVVRTKLGEAAFSAAWAEGRAMTLDEAVSLALAATDNAP